MQFAQNLRQRIETLIRQLDDGLTQGDEIPLQQHCTDLQAELGELDRQIRQLDPPSFQDD